MVLTDASNVYHRTAIETADPLQLIIFCYDEAIIDLKNAEVFHEKKQMDDAYRSIRHAQDIITELLVGLDYERGGDIARNLNRLYNFILRQLIGINSRRDTRHIRPSGKDPLRSEGRLGSDAAEPGPEPGEGRTSSPKLAGIGIGFE